MPTIRIDGVEVQIDDLEATSPDETTTKVVNQAIDSWYSLWDPGYHPYPDLAAAEFLVDKLGAKMVNKGKLPVIPEGAVA